ncbi:SHOCT-like domain-containing protein [Cellulosilyticum sp. I15G10I2]|uniref:SHOCT-like domain-containing protein n=1 Tax=Cellulosilyticum sp. I15G10I2 TaxID=1892843 RepID=UPI00085C648B|nr:hypothetical protein [Cellulosilyticum sp. I15G10I2]
MSDEVLKILKMVEDGKITADKAQLLIESINNKSAMETPAVSDNDIMNKMLKIKVNSDNGDNVDVKIPVKLIKTTLKALGKIPIDKHVDGMDKIDFNLISEAIDNGLCGKIVDVHSANGDIVEVVIE